MSIYSTVWSIYILKMCLAKGDVRWSVYREGAREMCLNMAKTHKSNVSSCGSEISAFANEYAALYGVWRLSEYKSTCFT